MAISIYIMAGLVPAIHVSESRSVTEVLIDVDARNKCGHDETGKGLSYAPRKNGSAFSRVPAGFSST